MSRTLFLVFVLGFMLGVACTEPTGPPVEYWAICEAPWKGGVHSGPFDTYQEAVDEAYWLEVFYGDVWGIYLDCEVRIREERPLSPKHFSAYSAL